MNYLELAYINRNRTRDGRPPLTLQQAQDAIRRRQPVQDEGFDFAGFLIGHVTGMPISPSQGISMGSVIGALSHPSDTPTADPTPTVEVSSPSYETPTADPSPSSMGTE